MQAEQDDNRPQILIVGAGIAGLTLAYELSKHPVKVSVLDNGEARASDVPVALLNPHRGRTAKATDLDKAGLLAMHDLATELAAEGLDSGISFSGVLRIASSLRQAKLWQKQHTLTWLKDVPHMYHAPYGAALVSKGGWLVPEKLLAALTWLAKKKGIRFVNTSVMATEILASKVNLISNEAKFEADKVIFCIGAAKQIAFKGIELEYHLGDVIELNIGERLVYPIAGAVYGAQTHSSLFIGGNHRKLVNDPDAVPRLKHAASWFIPAVNSAAIASQWSGTRAKQKDNQPLIKRLHKGLWFYGAFAGRGFLCAAYLSRLLAQQLLEPHDNSVHWASSQGHLPSDS